MILFIVAILAGALTALAPCVLPLLPVIIGGSISGEAKDRKRPYIITISLAISLLIFTYALKISSVFANVNPRIWVLFSTTLLISLGIVTLFPNIWERAVGKIGLQSKSDTLLRKGVFRPGVIGAIITGAALGPIFSSCSPTYAFILATVIPKSFLTGFLDMSGYLVGLVVALTFISTRGRKFLSKYSWAVDAHSGFRRGLGILFILIGIGIGFGYDKKIELWAETHSGISVLGIDRSLLQSAHPAAPTISGTSAFNVTPYVAPELVGIKNWINSNPLTMAQLKGKVVLIDFWTYSCINCIRSLPYVEKWYETYKDQGLVVIGVHAPEFSFEKVYKNVLAGVKQNGLTYPVAMDSDLSTWNAFNNQYWPAHYLIDKSGKVVGNHFGEGEYAKTEAAIQTLLGAKGPLVTQSETSPFSPNQTSETYLGSDRSSGATEAKVMQPGTSTFTLPKSPNANMWGLGGAWMITNDRIVSQSANSQIRFHVRAKDIYIVAGIEDGKPHNIQVSYSGGGAHLVGGAASGTITIDRNNLFHVGTLPAFADTTITLTIPQGVSVNTFTFGGN